MAFTADWQPIVRLALLAGLLALLPLGWWWWRHRDRPPRARLALLTALTLFLTFDLIVFGSFTRLTDSGLGCPDWPGCYGHASPVGAKADIRAAELALPTGPVTVAKAWIEMLHRYLAMVVGLLILIAAAVGWRLRRALPHSVWWGVATLVWVLVQGLFGKYTVTLKLYPAVVTLHLLGALILLALLTVQHESFQDRPLRLRVGRRAVAAVLGLVMAQAALGGWVSTNYAVLACSGFPTCNGQWWPEMDWSAGFSLLRPLGFEADGTGLPFPALVAVHWVHRLFAVVVTAGVLGMAWALSRSEDAVARPYAALLVGLLAWQVASGVSNVVLGWPILAALCHSAGAAALVGVLTSLLMRMVLGGRRPASSPVPDAVPAGHAAAAAVSR